MSDNLLDRHLHSITLYRIFTCNDYAGHTSTVAITDVKITELSINGG